MEIKNVLLNLRKNFHLSQSEMADRLIVTRQAVSSWENGETVPNTDTLKIISKEFNVSINTLLGSPRKLFSQCCGMLLYEDNVIAKNNEGYFIEEYCKWCFVDGEIIYKSMHELIEFLAHRMSSQYQMGEEGIREMLRNSLTKLNYWKE